MPDFHGCLDAWCPRKKQPVYRGSLPSPHASGRLPQIAAGVKGLSCDDFLTREVLSYQRITRSDNQRGGVSVLHSLPRLGALLATYAYGHFGPIQAGLSVRSV